MTLIRLDLVEIDYNVAYPEVDFSVAFIAPNNIPFIGGKRYDLGSTSLSLENTATAIPFSSGPLSVRITLTLDVNRCEVTVGGNADFDVLVHTYHWDIGPTSFEYLGPFILPEPPWSVNPVKVDPAALQAAINSAPDDRVKSGGGATSLRGDPATEAEVRCLLQFTGAGHFADQMIRSAQSIKETRLRVLGSGAVESVAAARALGGADTEVIVGLAIGLTGGVVLGLGGAYGLYFTSGGEIGTFGTFALDAGVMATLSLSASFLIYWPDEGLSAMDCFTGNNGFVAIDLDVGVSLGVSLSWPEDSMNTLESSVPCGIALSAGGGVGLPLNFYIGNSVTFLSAAPPPQLAPHGH